MTHVPDFHVSSLRYVLRESELVKFIGPPAPSQFETDEASFRLQEGRLTCDMKFHFADAGAARAVVEPVLRAWEVKSDLSSNRGSFRFEFKSADIIDRAPTEPGVVHGFAHIIAGVQATLGVGIVSPHVESNTYPPPPGSFRLNTDAESMLLRYEGYLDGREPMQAMAYFCLTVLQGTGKRADAVTRYNIERKILDTIGDLSSERGDRTNARKASPTRSSHPMTPLSGKEIAWLDAAIKLLIDRVGDTRLLANLPQITMADLPSI